MKRGKRVAFEFWILMFKNLFQNRQKNLKLISKRVVSQTSDASFLISRFNEWSGVHVSTLVILCL